MWNEKAILLTAIFCDTENLTDKLYFISSRRPDVSHHYIGQMKSKKNDANYSDYI